MRVRTPRNRPRYLLNNAFPVPFFPFVRSTLQRRLDFRFDLLPQRCDQLDVNIRFEQSGADLLKDCIEDLLVDDWGPVERSEGRV